MSEQSTAYSHGPLTFVAPAILLNAINLNVKCVWSTHEFLSDIFAQIQIRLPLASGTTTPPLVLSSNGKIATLRMLNTIICFHGCESISDSLGGYKICIDVFVNNIGHVKEVLKQKDINCEEGEDESQHPPAEWIEFLDKDGYTWRVGKLRM